MNETSFQICERLGEVVDAVERLVVSPSLPQRIVIVPRSSIAHALRRLMIQQQRSSLLVGTRFTTAAVVAQEILAAAGKQVSLGEGELRAARLQVLFARGFDPPYFTNELVMATHGWSDAFAASIDALERAGIRVDSLAEIGAPSAEGLAAIWRSALTDAPATWTTSRALVEAAEVLGSGLAFGGDVPILAVTSGATTLAEAELLRALKASIAFRPARPFHASFVDRVEHLFGAQARHALTDLRFEARGKSDLDIVAAHLFAPAETQALPTRPRASADADGTVRLELHAGVEAEIEACARWICEKITSGLALEEIAVLSTAADPWAQLVAERLNRLPGGIPIHAAEGLPFSTNAAGARIITVIRALAGFLSPDLLADVLPVVTVHDDAEPVSKGGALDLAYAMGTVGGSIANPAGLLEWATCGQRRADALRARLAEIEKVEGEDEQLGLARGKRDMQRLLRDLDAIVEPLKSLVNVGRLILDEAPLSDLWPALCGFLTSYVRLPGGGRQTLSILDTALATATADATCGSLSGSLALDLIERTATALRVHTLPFGVPAVYVGTVASAAGLPFTAVRVIGLCEGTIPPQISEDPVLAPEVRQRLHGLGLESRSDMTMRAVHDLSLVVRDTSTQVVLSAPRLTLERSYREPSAIFLEVAQALGRPTTKQGKLLEQFERFEIIPARQHARDLVARAPLGSSMWLERVSRGELVVPASWTQADHLDLERLATLASSDTNGAMDGVFGPDTPAPTLPGLTSERPISATALRDLLGCPHRFLLQRVLGWGEPSMPRSLNELDALAYGSLVHKICERFFREHGAEFCARKEHLEHWQNVVEATAKAELERLLVETPLAGETAKREQLARLHRETRALIRFLWGRPRSRFIAVERSFGYEEPLALRQGNTEVFVGGFVDYVEVAGEVTHVHDWKTSGCTPRHGRDTAPQPVIDIQLAIYGEATRRHAAAWGNTEHIGVAYVHTNDRSGRVRAFEEDYEDLRRAADGWVQTAGKLLDERMFPRTPHVDDCAYCHFRPVCGEDVSARAAQVLAAGSGALELYRECRK